MWWSFRAVSVKLMPLTKGCHTLMHAFSLLFVNIIIIHTPPKTDNVDNIFVADSMGLASTSLTQF